SPARSGRGTLSAEQRERFQEFIATSRHETPPFHSQLTSAPHVAADDYTMLPPTTDPLAFDEPVWETPLPGARRDHYVYSQPVVAGDSLICRHKNIVYSHSILNGKLRWKNDLGGRAVWQNQTERQYPMEDVLVQDGLVVTAMAKAGPSLVAID